MWGRTIESSDSDFFVRSEHLQFDIDIYLCSMTQLNLEEQIGEEYHLFSLRFHSIKYVGPMIKRDERQVT